MRKKNPDRKRWQRIPSRLARIFHTQAPNLANHLAVRRLGLLHRITADTLLSSEPSGEQRLTRSPAPVYEICGLAGEFRVVVPAFSLV